MIVLQSLIYGDTLAYSWGKLRHHDFYYLDACLKRIILEPSGFEYFYQDGLIFPPKFDRLSLKARQCFNRYAITDSDGFGLRYSDSLREGFVNAVSHSDIGSISQLQLPLAILGDTEKLSLAIVHCVEGNEDAFISKHFTTFDRQEVKCKALLYTLCFNAITDFTKLEV